MNAARGQGVRQGALIDRFLVDFDVREHHSIVVAAQPQDVYKVVRSLNLARPLPVLVLFAIRGLPRLITKRTPPKLRVTLDDLVETGFVVLAEEPGDEIVVGAVGKFWRPDSGFRPTRADEFVDFAEPGFAKAALNFSVEPLDGLQSRVSTETRVSCTDERARRNFLRYWTVIRPFSVLIRRLLLRSVKQAAEGAATPRR